MHCKIDSPWIKKGLFQTWVDGKIRCLVCERRCLLVAGGKGWCRTRENRAGTIYTLTYGAISSLSANPIEKKPLYHFFPSSRALTVGSWSCNFGCPWCQNWEISKAEPPARVRFLSPKDFIEAAHNAGCQGTSISFNEPTLSLEWSLDVFQLAREHNLYNTFVTNGYMTSEALGLLSKSGLDAMNVDIKGESQIVRRLCKGVDVEWVWRRCRQAREINIHLEVTTLVIPGVNDGDKVIYGIAERLFEQLGPEIPWHISAYQPAYRYKASPTPVSTLERAWEIGKDVGLEYVYLGNIPGHRLENTYCPECGELLIKRLGFMVTKNDIHEGNCPHCGRAIYGVWEGHEASRYPDRNQILIN
ncbi:MAG: AmmeMemoRadiSam system radical SAM enzyme [Anaerolineales bacterium]